MSECAEIDQPIKFLCTYTHVTRGYIDFVKEKGIICILEFSSHMAAISLFWPTSFLSTLKVNYAFYLTKAFLGFCLKNNFPSFQR